jgi:hypothetical protein
MNDTQKDLTTVLSALAGKTPAAVAPVKEQVAIADLTWAHIQRMDGEDYKALIKNPEGKAKIEALLAEREAARTAAVTAPPVEAVELTLEQQAAKDAEAAQAAAAEAARVAEEQKKATEAAEAAKAAELAAEVKKALDAAEAAKPKKYVYEFQAKDEAGNSIGNKTHLEATSLEELERKKEASYENAVRAIDRLKRQKVTRRIAEAPITIMSPEELAEAAKDLTSTDAEKRTAAAQKIQENSTLEARQKLAVATENAKQEAAAFRFMAKHIKDYNPCQANGQIVDTFMRENDLDWTVDNLEVAFANCESQLAPVEGSEPVVTISEPAPAANPVPAAVQPVAPAVAAAAVPAAPAAAPVTPVAAPAAAAPVTPAVIAAPNEPASVPVNRAGVNAGLVPGESLSGTAPVSKPVAIDFTLKDVRGWSPEEMKRRKRLDPKLFDKINALLAINRKKAAA